NIMNPPDFVKKLSSYVPGSPCSLYNKCLSCENAMITVAHLPHLFALYRDYSRLVEVSRVMDTPYGGVVRENMGILKTILNPETSDFSGDELSEAKRLSDYISSTVLVDGVGL
ncbi:integrase, partial [Pseudomonas japonica]